MLNFFFQLQLHCFCAYVVVLLATLSTISFKQKYRIAFLLSIVICYTVWLRIIIVIQSKENCYFVSTSMLLNDQF